jgi:VWFA-related protein
MQPADLVALVSLGDTLKVDQDFTADKNALINEVGAYNGTEGQGFAQGATPTRTRWKTPPATRPTRASTTTSIPTASCLRCARSRKSLEKINEKKSLLYFSGGISRDGIENQASLRSAINAAVRANLAIYSVDTRGLAGHFAAGRRLHRQPARTGRIQRRRAHEQHERQLRHAGSDGHALFRHRRQGVLRLQRFCAGLCAGAARHFGLLRHRLSQHESGARRQVSQADVKIDRPGIKLEYRPGYYAPADFKHSGKEDREQELEDQLASDLPATDMAVYMDAMYFRLDENRFFVPVSLVVPGSQIPFVKGGDKDKATLDIIGAVIDEVKRPIGRVRETVKLNLDPSLQARQKNIQYTTSFNLPPGKYQLKFVVRENQTGRMGSFIADITLPDHEEGSAQDEFDRAGVACAAEQERRSAGAQRRGVRAQHQPRLPPGPAPVSALRNLRSGARKAAENAAEGTKPGINLLSSLELIQGSTKVYETPMVQAKAINVEGRDAVAIELDVPLSGLKPGPYLCQLNVIDDA